MPGKHHPTMGGKHEAAIDSFLIEHRMQAYEDKYDSLMVAPVGIAWIEGVKELPQIAGVVVEGFWQYGALVPTKAFPSERFKRWRSVPDIEWLAPKEPQRHSQEIAIDNAIQRWFETPEGRTWKELVNVTV